jgi:hypothetical protein
MACPYAGGEAPPRPYGRARTPALRSNLPGLGGFTVLEVTYEV